MGTAAVTAARLDLQTQLWTQAQKRKRTTRWMEC